MRPVGKGAPSLPEMAAEAIREGIAMASVHVLKRVMIACSFALLIAGATGMSAQAATSSSNGSTASSVASLTSILSPALPGCGPFNDGEVIYSNGSYWECGYVMGIGWFWWEIPPNSCGMTQSQYAREIASTKC
jgi:hypothetical protein